MTNLNFRLDKYYYAVWKEKTLVSYIKVDDQHFIEAKMTWTEERAEIHGWKQATGRHIPTLHIATWFQKDADTLPVSHGLGLYITKGEPVNRRSIKLLEKIGSTITREEVLEIVENNKAKLDDARII